MKRQSEDLIDSGLDLLLDTITNAFGGILFISIMIVLMLRMTNTPSISPGETSADQPSQQNMLALQTRLADVLSQLATLQASDQLQQSLTEQLSSEELRQKHQELQTLRSLRDAAQSQQRQDVQQLAKRQAQNNRLCADLDSIDKTLADKQQELDAIQSSLAQETAARTRSAGLPHAKATHKREVALIVRYSRAYFVWNHGVDGEPRDFNTDDLLVLEEDSLKVCLTPKPYAGIPLADEKDLQTALRQRLSNLPAGERYLAFAVWEDSFEEFAALKKAAIDLGYEYRLLAIPQGESVGSANVENPRVQ